MWARSQPPRSHRANARTRLTRLAHQEFGTINPLRPNRTRSTAVRPLGARPAWWRQIGLAGANPTSDRPPPRRTCGGRARALGLVFVGASLLLPDAGAAAADGPRPPCGEAPQPAYADSGGSPNVQAWSAGDLGPNWRPPDCVSWTAPGFDVLVALAGSFADPGTAQDLLARFGGISRMTAIRYWSVTDQAWDPLVTSATALSGPDSGQRRPDFAPTELTEGSTLFFAQSDNRSSGEVVYRLLIRELRPDRLVIATENVTAVRKLILTMFAPGELQSTYFLERRSPGVWTYYSLSRTSPDANPLARGHAASYLNRAVALFRYVAGIPTDQEPPAARSD
jgi:hypothetical protein